MNGDNVLQSPPVQQLVAAGGSPNRRWSPMTTTTPPPSSHQSLHFATVAPPPHFFLPQNEPPSSMHSWHHDDHNQEFQDSSLCQLLLSGSVGNEEDDKLGLTQMQKIKKLENWEEQLLHDDHHLHQLSANVHHDSMVVKQEALSFDSYGYGEDNNDELIGGHVKPRNWSNQNQMIQLISSCPNSSVITRNKADGKPANHRSSESNSSSGSGGASKKAKVEPPSSNQSTVKVKKEKLGDRITALHQMVSPFGKTDTASVLLEVMGYIKFLEAQIQALSLPYFGVQLANMMHHKHSDSNEEPRTNLKSVGLCLVPVSCTMQVGSDNGADYWAPTNNLRL